MRKVALLFATVCLWGFTQAQETVLKFSGLDGAFGKYELSYERTFNEGMNNIKSSGKMHRQGKWPNIITKSSFLINIGYINENISQSFGQNLTFAIDTNTNADHDGNPDNGTQITDDSDMHSLQRDVTVKTNGFYIGAEYRSYIKTYKQKTGDAPRGWYIAPFAEVKFMNVDFDDNTSLEVNNAMAILLSDLHLAYEGDEVTGSLQTRPNPNFNPSSVFYNNLILLGLTDVNGNGLIETTEQPNPNILQEVFGWKDVSHKYNEAAFTGGLVIGRQWLFWDQLALDVQIGPQYKYLTRSTRTFNGNDTWNINNSTGQVGDLSDFYTKYWDVYNPTNDNWDPERLGNYNNLVDYNGDLISIRDKTNSEESQLRYNTGFNGDHQGLTDFAKLYTYRLKIKIGYSF
tara:strand:- start:269 stop:1474 length:1206 start_codon:yes stop_codon:yes gene_type:complete